MKFYRLKDAPTGQMDVVFRESAWNKAIAVLFGLALTGIFTGVAVKAHWCWGYCGTAFGGLLTCLFGSMFLHTFHPSNWLVRIGPRGILIKFRSFLNDQFSDEDLVVVELQEREIEWVGKTAGRRVTPGNDGGVSADRITYIDIKVKSGDLAELEQRLREERARPAVGNFVKSKALAYPVSVAEGGVIRINWRSNSTWITPKADQAVAILGQRTSIREEQRILVDLVTDPKDKARQEEQILTLAESGEVIAAVRLVRKRYGYSLTQAKQFVDDLVAAAPKKDSLPR